MGKIKDERQRMFGIFMRWLELNGLKADDFSMDAWGSLMLKKLHETFEKEDEYAAYLRGVPSEVLLKIVEERKKEKRIITPDKKIIT